ncbi:MAG: hypothetical protein QXW70_01125 [Candidatus Anstonellales archaeon]
MDDFRSKLQSLYRHLLRKHGYQGWWPLISIGYHPRDYTYPKSEKQKFEICIGAILTQNTSWTGAYKSIENLHSLSLLDPQLILRQDRKKLKKAITPAGYSNQKTRKLCEFSKFYISLRGRTPTRTELLKVWGIGPETADSILLYAYKVPTFVIDEYTKRFLASIAIPSESLTYEQMKEIFEKNLKKSYELYQEYHALIVCEEKEKSKIAKRRGGEIQKPP